MCFTGSCLSCKQISSLSAAATHFLLFRVDRTKYQIQIPLPPKIDASVTMMTVEEKPDVTYSDIGGCKEQIDKMREVVELPMLHPEKFVALGIDPPKGVLCYGPPGTGQHTCALSAATLPTGKVSLRRPGSHTVCGRGTSIQSMSPGSQDAVASCT